MECIHLYGCDKQTMAVVDATDVAALSAFAAARSNFGEFASLNFPVSGERAARRATSA